MTVYSFIQLLLFAKRILPIDIATVVAKSICNSHCQAA